MRKIVATLIIIASVFTFGSVASAALPSPGPLGPLPAGTITVITGEGYICEAKGAKIGGDGNTVRCPNGRQYRAGVGFTFVIINGKVYAIQSIWRRGGPPGFSLVMPFPVTSYYLVA